MYIFVPSHYQGVCWIHSEESPLPTHVAMHSPLHRISQLLCMQGSTWISKPQHAHISLSLSKIWDKFWDSLLDVALFFKYTVIPNLQSPLRDILLPSWFCEQKEKIVTKSHFLSVAFYNVCHSALEALPIPRGRICRGKGQLLNVVSLHKQKF